MDADVVVVGGGPAGMAAAAACADRGLAVAVLAPDHDAAWPNTYGIWTDELASLGDADVLEVGWPRVRVATGAAPPLDLERGYGLIANERLRSRLAERCEAGGARLVTGTARGLRVDGWPRVELDGHRTLRGRAVVDASGHRPVLLRPGAGRPPAWQAAYGLLATFPGAPPIEPGSMVFMDYRDGPLRGLPGVAADPTFLYGMDLGDGRWFVEETSLARRPALGFDMLAARLRRRLATAGARVGDTLAVERVRFPMGVPLPPTDQPAVGFGGAAGMVHPATGYQVGTALRRAPALAEALVRALDRPDATAGSVAAAGWQAVWPADLMRQRALHAFGLEALLRMDTPTIQRFFAGFFELGEPHWRGFVSGAPDVRDLSATMLALFRRAPGSLRRALVSPALGREGVDLLRALR